MCIKKLDRLLALEFSVVCWCFLATVSDIFSNCEQMGIVVIFSRDDLDWIQNYNEQRKKTSLLPMKINLRRTATLIVAATVL